MKGIIGEYN